MRSLIREVLIKLSADNLPISNHYYLYKYIITLKVYKIYGVKKYSDRFHGLIIKAHVKFQYLNNYFNH